MLNLNIYVLEEMKGMTKKTLCELLTTAQEKAVSEFKRSDFWEREAKKKDREATDAENLALKTEIKSLKLEIEGNHQDRIVDMMTVRGEWSKSEKKMVAKLKAANIYGDTKSDQLEVAKHSLMEAENEAKYWEEAWKETNDEAIKDEAVLLEKLCGMQNRVIKFLDR